MNSLLTTLLQPKKINLVSDTVVIFVCVRGVQFAKNDFPSILQLVFCLVSVLQNYL